ncbi:MAG: hypothetical protein WA755_04150 [Candidatus Acidiferrales bacterium]
MRRICWILVGIVALALTAARVRADELRLKDGTKILGTIVGFDENSFKVKTAYGFAIIRRDAVESIEITDTGTGASGDKKPAASSDLPVRPPASQPARASAPAPAPASSPAVTSTSAAPSKARAPKNSTSAANAHAAAPTATQPAPASSSPAPPSSTITPPATTSPAQPQPATPAAVTAPEKKAEATHSKLAANLPATSVPAPAHPSEPPKPAAPEPVREEVAGNMYTNETYGFHMFKPPDWHLIEGARSSLPGSIAALGTTDQLTYLLIGEAPATGSIETDLKASDAKLQDMLDNYRPLGDKRTTIAGTPAVERRFRGEADRKEWSGIVVLFERDKQLYTILGMTYAASDLVQIQENVIHRAITSIEFTR